MTINMKSGVVLVCGMLAMNVVAHNDKPVVAAPKAVAVVTKKQFEAQVNKAAQRSACEPNVKAARVYFTAEAAKGVKKADDAVIKATAAAKDASVSNIVTVDPAGVVTVKSGLTNADDVTKANEIVANLNAAKVELKQAQDKQAQVALDVKAHGDVRLGDVPATTWTETITSAPRKVLNYFWSEATGVQRAYRLGTAAAVTAAAAVVAYKYNAAADEDEDTQA